MLLLDSRQICKWAMLRRQDSWCQTIISLPKARNFSMQYSMWFNSLVLISHSMEVFHLYTRLASHKAPSVWHMYALFVTFECPTQLLLSHPCCSRRTKEVISQAALLCMTHQLSYKLKPGLLKHQTYFSHDIGIFSWWKWTAPDVLKAVQNLKMGLKCVRTSSWCCLSTLKGIWPYYRWPPN